MSSDKKSIEEVKPLVFTQTETCLAAVKGQSVNAPLRHSQSVLLFSRSETLLLHLNT